jgi:hypothetical protein
MEDEEEEDIFDFEDAQRCTPVRREHASGMVTPPSIRYNRLRPQQQLSMTPHPPPSNPESFGPSSPYFSDEDVAPQSLSPPPPSTPPPYSFYKPNQKATFFSLPLELRQQIYNLILGSQASVEIHKLSSDGTPPAQSGFRSPISTLLCICRRISEEASDILYNNTHFSLDLSEDENGLSHFSVGNLERMRKLQLLVFPREEYPMPVWLDPKLWNPVLSNLKSLTVVVQEPLDFEKPDKELSWKEAEQWRRWAGPILKYIDTRLPAEVEVEIDDDSRHITKALVDKNFKNHRIKRVETRPGDWLFIRGEVKKLHEEDECSVM